MIDQCPLLLSMLMYDAGFSRFCRPHLAGLRMMRLHGHHVWPGRRVNVPSNLLRVNPLVHEWLHTRTIEGRVAGIWARSRQPGFSWDELSRAAGRDVFGWLQLDKCAGLSRPYGDWREELIR